MKKFLGIAISTLMVGSMLIGCGSSKTETTTAAEATTKAAAVKVEEVTEAEDVTEAADVEVSTEVEVADAEVTTVA